MALETLNMAQVRDQMSSAVQRELPLLLELRGQVRSLKVQALGYRQCSAIAPVATDGGENRLTFDPINIEIIRVVDSDGKERLQKILPLSGGADPIRNSFSDKSSYRVPVLVEFLTRLGIEYDELSDTLDGSIRGGDLHAIVRNFREIAEWAVLLEIAWNPGKTKVLVIRDGLLRTKALNRKVIPKLRKSFEEAYVEHGSLLVGVAKRSKVLNYLSLALALEKTFARKYPCFCEVPRELEAKAYNWARDWMEGSTFGIMHLAKLVEHPDGIVFPVDIPDWLMGRRKEVLEYLAETAKNSFPTLGYPEHLLRAHENAVLHGLEMSVLQDLLLEFVTGALSTTERDKTTEHVTLGKGIQKGGWKEYG